MQKVLLYDIEVAPRLCWAYDMWDANIIHVERESYAMCFAYKWLDEDETYCVAQPDFAKYYKKNPYDDILVVETLWELMDEADVVIAHNATKFDNRVANERFLHQGLGAPSPYRTVDTLTLSRRYFKQGRNSLDYLCKKLDLGGKPKETHSTLWHRCVSGDMEAWDMMREYNRDDIALLENLYLRLRPFAPNHANIGEGFQCPKCSSTHVQRRGVARTNAAVYPQYHCQTCGAWSRGAAMDKTATKPSLRSI